MSLAALLAATGWIAWQAFVTGGWFTNPSADGPQRGDALAVVAAVLGLVLSAYMAYTVWADGHARVQAPVLTDAGEEVPSRPASEVLGELDRLGDDPSLAWRTLRVHRCIRLPPDAPIRLDPELPTWVERTKAPEVRAWMASARRRGGLLVVAGESSVGKTRLLYETALSELAGWPILSPQLGDGDPVLELASQAQQLTGPVIVWLDELHRFLPGPWLTPTSSPITGSSITRLLAARAPVVIVGSVWPNQLATLRQTRADQAGIDLAAYPEAADILRHADLIVLEEFDTAETDAARAISRQDPRLAIAAHDRHFGVTQALAGAPALLERYHTATEEHKALLHAAIDAQRIGIPPPVTASLLAAAARGYLRRSSPGTRCIVRPPQPVR